MSWNKVLEDYARLKRPERELPPGVFVAATRKTTTIFDGFEKAKFHLLILPREPFELEDGSMLSGPALSSLSQLLKSPHALQVLKELQSQAEEVKDMIRDEMEKEYGWSWGVQAGFHAVESMRHVHLHVISTDFLSPKLKNKKHWNSFHPSLGYFLHLSDVIAAVEAGKNPLRDPKHYEALLKTDLVSTYPPHAQFTTLPKLKEHLEHEWEQEGRRRKSEKTVEQQLSAFKIKGTEAVEAAPEDYKYRRFLPEWTTTLKLPPLEPFEHVDPGHKALSDPTPLSFLDNAEIRHLTPDFGSEIVSGVDLTALGDRERAQLALFVAKRGVVVFRDQQKFVDAEPEWWIKDWTSYFGRPHVHPVSGQPAAYPELHLVWREDKGTTDEQAFLGRLSTTTIHSDVSYEKQPPGLTALFLFDTPTTGGDTLFVDQVKAYKRLSPSFREYLETLQVEHSGFEQAKRSAELHGAESIKRQPVRSIHPLVRRHPVTGEKALYVNQGFSRRIVGLKQEESDAILGLLYAHIAQGHDFQARVRWGELGSVTLWDNRVTAHSALVDWDAGMDGKRRHGARLTPQAEPPAL